MGSVELLSGGLHRNSPRQCESRSLRESSESTMTIEAASRTLVWRGDLELSGDADSLRYRYRRQLWRDGELVRERTWDELIPRDHH